MHILLHVAQLPVDVEHESLRAAELEDLSLEAEVVLGALGCRPLLVTRPVGVPGGNGVDETGDRWFDSFVV